MAQTQSLLVIPYFFWPSGAGNQRSRRGLLATILYRSLIAYPELIPAVFPEEWVIKYLETQDPAIVEILTLEVTQLLG
jgi:hypothetical protein